MKRSARESRPKILGDGPTYVAVKQGLSRYSARQIAPVRARQMIEDGVRRALGDLKAVKPYVPAKPTTITVELGTVDTAARFMGSPRCRAGRAAQGDQPGARLDDRVESDLGFLSLNGIIRFVKIEVLRQHGFLNPHVGCFSPFGAKTTYMKM